MDGFRISIIFYVLALVTSCVSHPRYYHYDPSDGPATYVCGTVADSSVEWVLVNRMGEDFIHNPDFVGYYIRVSDSRFGECLPIDTGQVYELIVPRSTSPGSGTYMPFFVDSDTLSFAVNDHREISVSDAGILNRKYRRLKDVGADLWGKRMDSLYRRQEDVSNGPGLYTKEYMDLCSRAYGGELHDDESKDSLVMVVKEMSRSGESLTPDGRRIRIAFMMEEARRIRSEISRLSSEEPDLVNLYTMTEMFKYVMSERYEEASTVAMSDAVRLLPIYDSLYAMRFSGCTLHQNVKKFRAAAVPECGIRMPDFALPDRSGTCVSLHSIIDGKVSLVILWASWCGSCRAADRTFIPIYEQYSDKGFEVVGIAREYRDTHAWEFALEKDGYPWPNLVAMGDDHRIWTEMGSDAAGVMFLVDREGIVVKRNPSPEFLAGYLRSEL